MATGEVPSYLADGLHSYVARRGIAWKVFANVIWIGATAAVMKIEIVPGNMPSNSLLSSSFLGGRPYCSFEFPDLLAEVFFHIADHLRRRSVRELFRQLAASGEFGFYCLLFLSSIHNCMTAGSGESSKQCAINFE